MTNEYTASSSLRVVQMETGLSHQLSELRAEIEENGFPPGSSATKSYSSVPPPPDVSVLRAEREEALRRGLQVSEALQVESQADVMRRELESCLSREYTADSLPLLLHQFFTDRSYHLAQVRYLLMLRWRRFCRHTSVLEKLYPHYKALVSGLVSEYEDAVQRARRLALSREKILTGRGNLAGLVARDDAALYLRWLVCHLHSVQHVHNFLRVLHYMPACERKDEKLQLKERKHTDGPAEMTRKVPTHTVALDQFHPELQSLVSHFHLDCDAMKTQSTAQEMELFSLVWTEFRRIFRQQEQMRTFPPYDGTEVNGIQWGRRSANTALRKEASWGPFIQVKPRRDPWQQKLITKLKEKKCVDEFLQMHFRFLQVSDALTVGSALRDHAAHAGDLQTAPTSSGSQTASTKPYETSEIWRSVYNAVNLTQDTKGRGDEDQRSLRSQTSDTKSERLSCSYFEDVELLGLFDSLEEETSDPVASRGAYLSLIHLRHLKLRELQRITLGLLNYLRSVERTLTFDLAGLRQEDGGLRSTAEETRWMNAARGGRGEAGGLGSLQYSYNTPVDYKVHCSEFMEFAEVENLHDFYSAEERLVHTQDQRGFYVVYDAALKDLEELQAEMLLVGSHYIQKNAVRRQDAFTPAADRTGADVDRVSVLLDLWACEAEFLESKVQVLNCYFEAYQHVIGAEERFSLAQVITDIMHSRPHLDLDQDYFVESYRAEISCLQSHQQLIRAVLDTQIEQQRLYLQRIWRNGSRGSIQRYGLPLNYVPKHAVSLGGSRPALMNVFLLEVHPSLCLASDVYHTLVRVQSELCELHRARSVADKLLLRWNLLQGALQSWNSLASPAASYSPQIQKDLHSDVFFDDPSLVEDMGSALVSSAEEKHMKEGEEKQLHAVETFSRLLELVTIRHRLLESSSETAHLAQLYRRVASDAGFDEFHLYVRPVQFELAEHKHRAERRPAFITELLEDDSCVDRFRPPSLPLAIQELDENQIWRFSFSSEESVLHLMNDESVANLQVTLACQIVQKNALISAVKQAGLCYWAGSVTASAPNQENLHTDRDSASERRLDSKTGSEMEALQDQSKTSPFKGAKKGTAAKERLTEAFVSIQLEKLGLRDEMLDSFVKKKQAVGGIIKTLDESAKIKRGLILDFLRKFSAQTSQYSVRAQIIAYYFSLTSILDDIPSVRQSHFMIGRASVPRVGLDAEVDLCPDPRTFQRRPQQLLSADGEFLLNLWFIPHYSHVLHMFKTLHISACVRALHHTLEIASALHDIVYYLVSFSRLGNTGYSCSWRKGKHLAADWGGTEGIGAELLEIQRQVNGLSDPSSPQCVSRLLQLRRQVLFLQFDAAVRHLIREAFLSSGDVVSYQSVSDNMASALQLLSDTIPSDTWNPALPVPQPLDSPGCQTHGMFPWRTFTARHGLFPLRVWEIPPIEFCMQLCLCGLSDRSRLQANAAILGVSLLMEDVVHSGEEAAPVRLHGDADDSAHRRNPKEEADVAAGEAEVKKNTASDSSAPLQDPIRVQSVLRGFLLLTKQLQVLKERWAQRHLGIQMFSTPQSYKEFLKLYRAEIFYPSMRALAQHEGKQREYELFISGNHALLPPPGASVVNVEIWQIHRLLESAECHMIRAVQTRLSRDLTLVISEGARQDTGLPTDLWKKSPLKHNLSPERPQIVETFVQQLMEGAEEEAEGKLSVSQVRLQQCLTRLGCSAMERERRNFLLYSQFYEQIIQQQAELLHHREQDLKNLEGSQLQTSSPHKEVAVLCRGMMSEISALRARVAHLEEEKKSSEKQLGLQFKERYDPLVRQLFSTCIQLKSMLDENQRRMEQDVSVTVNRIRREGVDRIIRLKKKHSCRQDDKGLELTQAKKEDVHELKMENSQLSGLICKVKALSRWREALHQGKLRRELLLTQQREISNHTEALRVKMTAEEQVALLREELEAAQQALARCQAECCGTKRLLDRKTEELQVVRRRSAQEARSRQEVDSYREQSLEQMRAGVEDRDTQLRLLSEQLDRGSKMSRLQRQRSAKEIRQVKGQLQQERCLKQEAFQHVDKLQSQVSHMEAALSRSTSTAGQSKAYWTPALSRLGAPSPSAGGQRASQLGSLTHYTNLDDWATKPSQQRADNSGSRCATGLDRPKADPSRLRVQDADALLPNL